MTFFGKKPSEIRKAIVAVCAAVLTLAVALPVAGLPVGVVAVITGAVAIVTGVSTYLSQPNVAAVIDSADNLN